MLSGGLDSNSIAAVAATQLAEASQGPLPTLSAISSNENCSESEAIKLAIRSPLFLPVLVRHDKFMDDPAEALRMTQNCAEPFDAYSVLHRAVYGAARDRGMKVVFDGAGADLILTAGNRVSSLLRQGNVSGAVREACLESQFWGQVWQARGIFFRAAWSVVAPAWVRRARSRLVWWIADHRMRLGRCSVSREFARAVDLGHRRNYVRSHLWKGRPTGAAYRAHTIGQADLVVARERYDRVASAFGIEPRDPFMDIRLITFILSLPSEHLQTDGWPKTILRRAMNTKVPAEIAWRRGKPHVGWIFVTELIRKWETVSAEQWSHERVVIITDSKSLPKTDTQKGKDAWFKVMILKSWLDRNAESRVGLEPGGVSDDNEKSLR